MNIQMAPCGFWAVPKGMIEDLKGRLAVPFHGCHTQRLRYCDP